MNDKIDRCTDPENCRRCSQDADTPHAGIARVRPGSDNHHAPKPEAQAAGVLSGLRRYYFDGEGVDDTAEFVRLDEAEAALTPVATPGDGGAQ